MGHGTRATPTTSLTTTAGFTEHTRLWRLRFNAATSRRWGTVQLVVEGPAGESGGQAHGRISGHDSNGPQP